MSHFSINPADVRVDFFKPSGKWYTTECMRWTAGWRSTECLIYDGFKQSLRDHFKDDPDRMADMDVVCLEPYHEYSHPLQVKAGGWNETEK